MSQNHVFFLSIEKNYAKRKSSVYEGKIIVFFKGILIKYLNSANRNTLEFKQKNENCNLFIFIMNRDPHILLNGTRERIHHINEIVVRLK